MLERLVEVKLRQVNSLLKALWSAEAFYGWLKITFNVNLVAYLSGGMKLEMW